MSCLHYLQKKSLSFFPSSFFFFFFELFLIFLYKQKTDTAEKNTQLDNKRGYKKKLPRRSLPLSTIKGKV
jgi:hypothetical protein